MLLFTPQDHKRYIWSGIAVSTTTPSKPPGHGTEQHL